MHRYRVLEVQLRLLRTSSAPGRPAEDAVIDEMARLWSQLSDEEREMLDREGSTCWPNKEVPMTAKDVAAIAEGLRKLNEVGFPGGGYGIPEDRIMERAKNIAQAVRDVYDEEREAQVAARNIDGALHEDMQRSIARLINEKERVTYWVCLLLVDLERAFSADARPGLAHRTRDFLADLNYDNARIERMIAMGEPGVPRCDCGRERKPSRAHDSHCRWLLGPALEEP